MTLFSVDVSNDSQSVQARKRHEKFTYVIYFVVACKRIGQKNNVDSVRSPHHRISELCLAFFPSSKSSRPSLPHLLSPPVSPLQFSISFLLTTTDSASGDNLYRLQQETLLSAVLGSKLRGKSNYLEVIRTAVLPGDKRVLPCKYLPPLETICQVSLKNWESCEDLPLSSIKLIQADRAHSPCTHFHFGLELKCPT